MEEAQAINVGNDRGGGPHRDGPGFSVAYQVGLLPGQAEQAID